MYAGKWFIFGGILSFFFNAMTPVQPKNLS